MQNGHVQNHATQIHAAEPTRERAEIISSFDTAMENHPHHHWQEGWLYWHGKVEG